MFRFNISLLISLFMKVYMLSCVLGTVHILSMKKPIENTLCHFVLTPSVSLLS